MDLYHDELQSHGVTNYDRRALNDDYRLSALWAIRDAGLPGERQHPDLDLVEQFRANPSRCRGSGMPAVAGVNMGGLRRAEAELVFVIEWL